MAIHGADQKARSEESALGALEGPSHAFDFPSGYTPLDVLGTTSSILVSHRPLKARATLRDTGGLAQIRPQARPLERAFASWRRMGPWGYSLLEIAITLGIAALLLGISLASWGGGIRERRVVRAAEDLAGLLRFAQQAAAADAADSCLYRVVVASTQAEARKVARADPGGCSSPEVVATVRVTDQFAQAVVVASTTVEFTSAGRLSGNTPVSISVSSGGRTRYVRVEPETGRVEVSLSP